MRGSAWCRGEREVVFTRLKVGEVVSKDHYLHCILPVLLNKTAFKSEDAGTNMPTFYRFVLLTVCACTHMCMQRHMCIYAVCTSVYGAQKRPSDEPEVTGICGLRYKCWELNSSPL